MKPRRSRKFSQHFLNSAKIAERIIASAGIRDKTVIEIGPGKGSLTRAIANHAAQVYAIEVDAGMVRELHKLNLPNVRIIQDDFICHDIAKYGPVAVIGNIPYSISSAIIEKLMRNHTTVMSATLTVQREFAWRLIARPGTERYGFMTLFVNYYYAVKKKFAIAARFFTPQPRVSSTVIHMEKRMPMFDLVDEKKFFDFIRAIYRYPRKAVKNALVQVTARKPVGIDEHLLVLRPAALTVEDFYVLYMSVISYGRR